MQLKAESDIISFERRGPTLSELWELQKHLSTCFLTNDLITHQVTHGSFCQINRSDSQRWLRRNVYAIILPGQKRVTCFCNTQQTEADKTQYGEERI